MPVKHNPECRRCESFLRDQLRAGYFPISWKWFYSALVIFILAGFSAARAQVATPTQTAPANNATNISVTPTLTWTEAAGAKTYKVKVYLNGDQIQGSPFTVPTSGGASQSLTLPVLLYSSSYLWNVKAIDKSGNQSQQSVDFKFTTRAIPGPAMVYPPSTLTGVDILPDFQFTWAGKGTVTCELNLTPNPGTSILPAEVSGVSPYHFQWTEDRGFLANNTTYTYTVTVRQGVNSSSTTGTFKTAPAVNVTLSNPSDNKTNVEYTSTYFSWYLYSGAGNLQYKLQVAAKEGAIPPTQNEWTAGTRYTGSDLFYSGCDLSPNTKYWWRVLVLNSDNHVISKSAVRTFTTAGGPVVPVLSYPVNGKPVYTNNPTLYWYTKGYDLNNIVFDVYISPDDMNHPVLYSSATGLTELSYTVVPDAPATELLPGKTYYWQVVARTLSAPVKSLPSLWGSFNTQGAGTVYKPILSYPKGNVPVLVYTANPVFTWYIGAYTSGVNYRVILSTISGVHFNDGIFFTSEELTDQFYYEYPCTNLKAGMTYYWKVIPNADAANTSAEGAFTISGSLGTGYPVVSYPKTNPVLTTRNPKLLWYMSGNTTGLDGYKVAWSTTLPADWKGAANSSIINDLSQTYYEFTSALDYGAHYYWAVAGVNGAANDVVTSWSTGEFTIYGGPTLGKPVLSAPTGGTTVYLLKPTLLWWVNGSQEEIDGYDVTYSRLSTFKTGKDPDGHPYTVKITWDKVPSTSYTITEDLIQGATYYWKVKAHYTNGQPGAESNPTGSFVVAPGAGSVVPIAGSPAKGVEIKGNSALLSWIVPAMSTSPLTYEVQYSATPEIEKGAVVTGLQDQVLNIDKLTAGQEYYWRVRSKNANGEYSSYSETEKFIMNSTTDVNEPVSAVPAEFSLSQNYPNPFNPSTEIKFGLDKDGFVMLKIYNVLGQEVRTLLNAQRSRGTYSVKWDGRDNNGKAVQSGTYVYRLTQGDNVSAKKMVMLK